MSSQDEDLLTTVWQRLEDPKTSTNYYIKFVESANSFTVLTTDLVSVWKEHFDNDQIKHDVERFCPQISMDTPILISHIKSCLLDKNKQSCTITLELEDNELIISIDATLLLQARVTIPFKWQVVLLPVGRRRERTKSYDTSRSKKRRRGNDDNIILIEDVEDDAERIKLALEERIEQSRVLHQHVLSPLLGMVFELNEQVEYLKQQCIKKDQDLIKFRETYGNNQIQSSPVFDLVNYYDKLLKSSKTFDCFDRSDLSLVDPQYSSTFLQRLYTCYMKYKYVAPSMPPPTPLIINTPTIPPELQTPVSSNKDMGQVQTIFESTNGTNLMDPVLNVDSDMNLSLEEITEKERQRKQELEEKLQEKKIKEKQNEKKKKMRKIFM
jgi:hypothetical protein